jgi:hypothetical protein
MERGKKRTNLISYHWDELLEYLECDYVPDNRSNYKLFNRYIYDREYPNIILIFFKSGAGGLFLANCLSLSENVLSTFNTIEEKIDFLEKYIDSQKIFWNDCYLNNMTGEFWFPSEHKEKYFMIYDHDPKNIPTHINIWQNLSVIYFKNPDLFCKMRRVLKNVNGNLLHTSFERVMPEKEDFPIPNSFEEYFELSEKEQNKLKEAYKSKEKFGNYCFLKNKKPLYTWDTNWYFSKNDTLKKVKELYDLYGFDDYNEEIISRYYDKWIKKIMELKKYKVTDKILEIGKDENTFDKPIMNFYDL